MKTITKICGIPVALEGLKDQSEAQIREIFQDKDTYSKKFVDAVIVRVHGKSSSKSESKTEKKTDKKDKGGQ